MSDSLNIALRDLIEVHEGVTRARAIKRSAEPSTNKETTVVVKRAKRNTLPENERGKRPRLCQYDELSKRVIAKAQSLYRYRLSTMHAYPKSDLEATWLPKIWAEACKEYKVHMEMDSDVQKLVGVVSLVLIIRNDLDITDSRTCATDAG